MIFSEKPEGRFEGVPGGLGVLLSVAAGLESGPIGGALVALVGSGLFVAFVTDFRPGSQLVLILWTGAAVVAGVIAGRLREADRARSEAAARERLAAARLHRLQAVTGALASATTAEEVAAATVRAAMSALAADGARLIVRSEDDPETVRVLSDSAVGDPPNGWQDHRADRPTPGVQVLMTGRPVFVETRAELLTRYPIVARIGRGDFGAFAGVPVAMGAEVLGALAVSFVREHMVPPEERGLLVAIAHQAAVALDRVRAEDRERRARAAAEAAGDRLRKLQRVSDAANAASGLEEMLAGVLPLVREAVRADGTSFLLLSDDRRGLHAVAAEGVEEHAGRPTVVPFGAGASGRIAATGRPMVIGELSDADVISAALRTRRSYVGVPVRVRGRVVGVLHASSVRPDAFEDADADFLQSIADSLAVTIDRTRLFDQRDQMASALERALLPMSLPQVPGFEIATMYRPSHLGTEVGGDFYDVFGDGRIWYVAIGDVCGKGPEAAAIMGMTRVALRSLARENDTRSLAEVLRLLNGFLLDSELMGDRFCTVCLARLESTGGGTALTVCLGGHPPPLLVRAGRLEPVGTPGSLLGLFEDVALHEVSVPMTPGDTLALFTDGVTEASIDDPIEGERLLRSALLATAGEEAAAVVKHVERSILDPREQRDDAAIIVAKHL